MVCVCMYVCFNLCVRICVCRYEFVRGDKRARMCLCINTYKCIYMYTHTHTHTHIHTYVYIYIYVYSTPVVKLVSEAFQPFFSRWLRWFMKPRWELYLLFFSCSFFSAQSSFVSIALVYSKNTHIFFPCPKLGHPAFGL